MQIWPGDPALLTQLARHGPRIAADVETVLGAKQSWDQAGEQGQADITDMRGRLRTWDLADSRAMVIWARRGQKGDQDWNCRREWDCR